MHRFISRLLAASAILVVVGSATVHADVAPTSVNVSRSPALAPDAKAIEASWQLNPPVVNGFIGDWANIPHYTLDNTTASYPPANQRPAPNDLSAWAAVAWDSDYVYFAISVVDDVVVRGSNNWYDDDMASVTIDLNRNGVLDPDDFRLTINPEGPFTNNDGWPAGVNWVSRRTNTGWLAEFSIPLFQFGYEFLSNAEVGFNWGVQDNDGQGAGQFLLWEGNVFGEPSQSQGALRFVNGPTRQWIVGRPGQDGYDGITDATLNQWPDSVNTNNGQAPIIGLRGREQWHVVLKAIPPTLPPNAKVLDARLHISFDNSNRADWIRVRMYRLLRPWDEQTVTWARAATNTPWATAGASKIGADRSDVVLGDVRVDKIKTDYVFPLGSVIQDLYTHPENNHGFIFRAEDGGNVLYNMYASESGAATAPWIEVFIELPPPTSANLDPQNPASVSADARP